MSHCLTLHVLPLLPSLIYEIFSPPCANYIHDGIIDREFFENVSFVLPNIDFFSFFLPCRLNQQGKKVLETRLENAGVVLNFSLVKNKALVVVEYEFS